MNKTIAALALVVASPAFAQTAAPVFTKGNQTASAGATIILDTAGNPVGTATNPISTTGSVSVTSLPSLPAFASTPTVNIGSVPTIAVTGTFYQTTQPVSVTSLPLPAGSATSANQATANASLATIASVTAAAATSLSAPTGTATSTEVSSTISDTSTHTLGPFTPQLARQVWCLLNATVSASGSAQVQRSIDGGSTMPSLTAGGLAWASYTFSNATGAIANEPIATETSSLATYYITITLTAGTVVAKLYQ